MREVKTEIEIKAPVETVWTALIDFKAWSEWNPIVNYIIGKAEDQAKLKIIMTGANGTDGQKYQAEITEFNAPYAFRWRAKMMTGLLFTNDKTFLLSENNGITKLTHCETFSGLFVPLFWGKLSKFVPSMLNRMNTALKIEIEKS